MPPCVVHAKISQKIRHPKYEKLGKEFLFYARTCVCSQSLDRLNPHFSIKFRPVFIGDPTRPVHSNLTTEALDQFTSKGGLVSELTPRA